MRMEPSDSLKKPRLLYRGALRKKLMGIFETPLFFVITDMGYGKTTAVRDFLRRRKRLQTIWFAFEEDYVEDMWLWVRFCKRIESVNKDLGSKLLSYGVPRTNFERNRFVVMLKEVVDHETVMVFDDMHFCRNEVVIELIRYVAEAAIPNLHIVLISREYPDMPVGEMLSAGRAKIVSQNDLAFSPTECADFFTLNDVYLTDAEREQLWDKTRGWASGIYLAYMYYQAYGSFDSMPDDTTELVRLGIYDGFDEDTRRSLVILSKVPHFALDQAEQLTGDKYIANIIRKMHGSYCFTRFEEESGLYSFHSILAALLRSASEIEVDEKEIFRRQAGWCLASDNTIDAIDYFDRSGDYERILTIIAEGSSSVQLMHFAPNIIQHAFDNMSLETRLSNPIGYLTYIYMYSTSIDVAKGADMLREAREYYSDPKRSPGLYDRNQILGEIALIESIRAFNDIFAMFECYERAYDLFDGETSKIFNSEVCITFGVPLNMLLYHKEPGSMDAIVKLVEDRFWVYNRIANGSGAGFEFLMKSEYYFKRGMFDEAEMHAYKAIYKAKTKEQADIILTALFVLIRIAFFNRKGREVNELLLQMMQEAERSESPVILSCYEMILGYMLPLLGNFNTIPRWLMVEEEKEVRLMSVVRATADIIRGKILCEQGHFAELYDFSEKIAVQFLENGFLDGWMIAMVYKATCAYHLKGVREGAEILREVVEVAEQDDVCLTLAENTFELQSMLEYIDTPFAKKVKDFNREYIQAKNYFRSGEKKKIVLSKREKEVMELVCDGLTADAISRKLYISLSTVKKHIAKSYEKLGVNKKADAIAAYRRLSGKTDK